MLEKRKFYIDGEWVNPISTRYSYITNPATEEDFAVISLGAKADVDKAVAAAKKAFATFQFSSLDERIALMERISKALHERNEEIAIAISKQMGAPMWLARSSQAPSGYAHFDETLRVLKNYAFERKIGKSNIVREPVGICGLITPWNWPINQVACKVAPAIATGCTMVLKPSELAPLDAMILADIIDKAGVPKGVFNLVNGDGLGVGVALSSHHDIDFVSFTGSTRAGIEISKNAAPTVKRVALELGGKSPNIVLEDADLQKAVSQGVRRCFGNSGQSCNSPTRMLVPRKSLDEVRKIAKQTAESIIVADSSDVNAPKGSIGPLANARQFDKVSGMIKDAIDAGIELVAGGVGRPDGFQQGFFVKPTVFISPDNHTTIAREEVFGPVLTIITYEDEEDAINIANDTPYGLSAYVQSSDLNHARKVARKIRAGNVHINNVSSDDASPFGGYKQSGNGREWGEYGLEEYTEIKAILGYDE